MIDKWTRSAELVNQRGLHARASAAFAREAVKYDARTLDAVCNLIARKFDEKD
jgi:hypothetical protein